MHVLFLLAKELCANGVQRVAAQLVLALHVLEHIDLQTAVEDGVFRVALAKGLRRKVRLLRLRLSACTTSVSGLLAG